MPWLSGWLKEIVVIILLASFVDLLLPNRSMQRYVKTVIGLFIVMVLMAPIFQLFQKGWDPNQLVAEAENLGKKGESQVHLKTLEEIMAESNRLKRINEKEAVRMAESQASQAIRDGLAQSEGIRASEVRVTASPDEKGLLRIAHVQVLLPPDGTRTAGPPAPAGTAEKSNGMEPVKPVSIVIVPLEGRQKAGGAADADSERRIKAYLQQAWQIKPELAVVTVEKQP